MSDIQSPVPEHQALSPRRSANGRTPPGYRVLHVIVPEQIFNHVKAQAYLSGLRFPDYVAHFLEEAWPYQNNRLQQHQMSTQVPTPVNAAPSQR
jgi:hypothetical protein